MLPILGIFLALCAAAAMALAMVTQRYALSYRLGVDEIPFIGTTLPRNIVWTIGFVMYACANICYSISLLFGPLSLLAGIFTTLLVFNKLFSWYMLDEEITIYKIGGSMMILAGVVLCVVATPNGVDTKFTPDELQTLTTSTMGALYLAFLVVTIVISFGLIWWYEALYPLEKVEPSETNITKQMGRENSYTDVSLLDSGSSIVNSGNIEIGSDADSPPASPLPSAKSSLVIHSNESTGGNSQPAPWLDAVMGLIYPASLGVNQGTAHLCTKAFLTSLDTCSAAFECHFAIIYIFLVALLVASGFSIWWLRVVFARYESTKALPVEYGAVNIISVCSGFLFFRESVSMAPWQVSLTLLGVAIIASGIGFGRLNNFNCVGAKVTD
jgi:uncharacterized membrane protein